MNNNVTFDLNTNPAEFQKIQIIGRGGFGCVYELKHIPTGLDLAGKQINEENLGEINKQALERENNIMKVIVSPYAVRYYGKIIFENQLTVLMDFCDRGSLRDIMNFKNKTLTEPQIAFVMHDLLTALDLIHKKKILHRDIKAANILATSHGDMKLTDFGVSRQFAEDAVTLSTITTIGTPYWMAPEVITPGKKYTFPADVWSVGATAVELAEGGPPYAEYEPNRAMIEIRKNGFPGFRQGSTHSKLFQDFVNSCMVIDPALRPKIPQLLRHPFVTQADKLDRMKVLEDLVKDEIDFSQLVDDEYEEEEEEEEEAQEDDDDDSLKSLNFNNPTIVASHDKLPKTEKKQKEEPEPEEEEEDEDDGLLKPLRFDHQTMVASNEQMQEPKEEINPEQKKEENPEPKEEINLEPKKEENPEPKEEINPEPKKEESPEQKKESDSSNTPKTPTKQEPSSAKAKKNNDKTVIISPVKKSKNKKFSTRTQGPAATLKNQKRFETFIQPSKESVNDIYTKKVESKPIKIDESLIKETKETVPIQPNSTVTQNNGGMNKMKFYGAIVLILAVLYLALGTKKFVLILILLLPILFLTKNLF